MYKGNSIFENGSNLTDLVCLYAGFTFCNAIKTMVRNKTIYVRATLLKPHEVYAFQELDGVMVDGMPIKTMG